MLHRMIIRRFNKSSIIVICIEVQHFNCRWITSPEAFVLHIEDLTEGFLKNQCSSLSICTDRLKDELSLKYRRSIKGLPSPLLEK
ncbi:hypothetical protein L1887_05772 [Cichorium endivia]|nr:hypothetical protein L1887_05772 [Cichorium endivia]